MTAAGRARARPRALRQSSAPALRCVSVSSLPSSTIRRPPTAMAQVARMRPFSTRASLVVPPPMSTLSRTAQWLRDKRDRARTMRRHLAFHVMAGGRAHEFAGLLREQVGNGAGISPLERLAGEDDRPAVNRLAVDSRIGITSADESRELVHIDGVIGPIGREQDRRLPQDFSTDHHEAARQRCRQPLQVHAREHQVRGR